MAIRVGERRRHPIGLPAHPRVLLIRPDHMGDVLLSTPSVELLRKALPEAHLAMMVGPWGEEVASRDPLLDEVLLCPFPGFTRAPKESVLAPYLLLRRTASELKRGGYDAAVVLRFDHWWGAWLAALAGIPVRVGHRVRECAPFLTHAVDPAGRVHWAEQSLRAVGQLLDAWNITRADSIGPASQEWRLQPERDGRDRLKPPLLGSRGLHGRQPALRFHLVDDDKREAAGVWDSLGLDAHRPVVVFHPGSGAPLKLWPEERWTALGSILAARGVQVVVTGSASETGMAERIARGVPGGSSAAGRTGLGGLAALFRRCGLVVGVDSGPLHLAVAMDTPTVHLFGPTDPEVFGPWGDGSRHRVVASGSIGAPCGRLDLETPDGKPPACMESIAAEQVAQLCLEISTAPPLPHGGSARNGL